MAVGEEDKNEILYEYLSLVIVIFGIVLVLLGSVGLAVKLYCPWLKHDLVHIRQMKKAKKRFCEKLKRREMIIDTFEEYAKRQPEKPFIIFEDESYSYEYVNQQANRVARAALEIGLQTGDIVAIMISNEPTFIWTFLGLQKIGVQVAFINYLLRSKSLLHCITTCQPKILIVGQGYDFWDAVEEVKDELPDVVLYIQGPGTFKEPFHSFQEVLDRVTSDPVDGDVRASVELTDPCQFIFTSGTTGLPKAAIINQLKAMRGSVVCTTFDLAGNDIFYETLPLYHSAAGELGLFNVIDKGATMVLRRKFSATQFWNDCRKHDVTVIHYIGELCRYLIARPQSPDDGVHGIRVAFGNGLRQDVWRTFQERFRIPQIAEFYGATEAPMGFINVCNQFGSIGRTSPLLKRIFLSEFLKYDVKSQEPVQDSQGRYVKAGPGEIGLLLVPITGPHTFEGYKGKQEWSEKKLLRNVFEDGDVFFDSGDLFYIDDNYFLYFKDRLGDTFRWKGENVSTSEISNVLTDLEFVQDANVYGVDVPGCEGKAGMAAIYMNETQSLTEQQLTMLSEHCHQELASYARPRFVRVQRQMSLTSTFKQRKVELIDEAFDPSKVNEVVYYLNPSQKKYTKLDDDVFQSIVTGNVQV